MPLHADNNGRIVATLTIPAGLTAGTKRVAARGRGGTTAETAYTGSGIVTTRVLQRAFTTRTWRQAQEISFDMGLGLGSGGDGDPLAQTFFVPAAAGAIGRHVTGVDVEFCVIGDRANAVVCQVPLLDMLRYHQFTIGRAWSVDYGLSENEKEFSCLLAYSPLHNVEKIKYPATMITTADHDDRVVPAHSFKFAATLQENQQGDNPVLIRIETSAGHGAGKPTSKLLEEAADMLSFMMWNMRMRVIY